MFTSFVAATLGGKITFKRKPSPPRTERDETLEQLYVRHEQFLSAFEYAPMCMALSALLNMRRLAWHSAPWMVVG